MFRASALALILAACGGDVDLTGIYRVDSRVGGRPCGMDQPVANGSPYVRFHRENLFGQDYFAYDDCPDDTGDNCSSVGGLFGGFYEPIDRGWLGVQSFSCASGGQCALGYDEQTALLNGNQLEIDHNLYGDTVLLSADACTPSEAEKRGDAMSCTQHTHIEATKL